MSPIHSPTVVYVIIVWIYSDIEMYEYPSIIMHMKITYEERKEMSQIKGIFERATIRGIADYLLFGTGLDKEERDYEERMDEIYQRLETAVAKYDSNPNSELLDLCNELTSETASVYMEIGLQVGILLMQEIKKNKDREN